MKVSMYELTRQYQSLLDFDADPTVEDTDAWNALMGELQDNIETKAVNVGYVLRTIDRECELLREEEKRLAGMRHVKENKRERLRDYLLLAMQATGCERAEAVDIKVSRRKTAPALKWVDEGAVPETFYVPQDPKLDRRALLDHVKNNPDCKFAIAEAGETITIK